MVGTGRFRRPSLGRLSRMLRRWLELMGQCGMNEGAGTMLPDFVSDLQGADAAGADDAYVAAGMAQLEGFLSRT